MTALKRSLASLVASLALLSPAAAQLTSNGIHITLGGGYLEQPEAAYFVGQVGTTVYEDARFAHTIFLEILAHSDEATVDFFGPRGRYLFTEQEDILFGNLTGNYELEFKVINPVSLYAGAGAGVEAIAIGNNDFDGAIDDDYNFVAQVFAGVRVQLGEVIQASAGVRRIFREDFELLNDQFITEDTWGFDFSLGIRF